MSTPPPIQPPPPPMPPMPPPQAGGVPVPNYMVWAIIFAILGLCFCCGVGAITVIVGICLVLYRNFRRNHWL